MSRATLERGASGEIGRIVRLSMQVITSPEIKHTGQDIEKIEKALERDNFMNPEDAKAFGLLDHVVETRAETGDEEGDSGSES